MKIIVGLGNPGNQYNFTRHNLGFLALDFYAKVENLAWEKTAKRSATYLEFTKNREKVIFLKPQTFYNNSGISVREWLKFYKLTPSDILVTCDDFYLEFGKIRWRAKGSDGGNNGLKSIITELGTAEFPRLRLGTGNDALRKKMGDTDFVLGKFIPEERAELPNILLLTKKRLDDFLLHGIS